MQRAYCKPFAAIFVCLTLFASALLPGSALAAPAVPDNGASVYQAGPYAVSTGAVYVRSGPGTGFWVLGTLALNELVPILGVSPDSAWWYINARFGEGWVAGISVTPYNTTGVPVRDPGVIGTVTAGALNVRFGPGFGSASLGTLGLGDQVFVLAQNAQGTWMQIRWEFGTGWVSAHFLTTTGAPMAMAGEEEAIPLTTDTPYAIVMATYLNVRSGPGINYTSLGQVFAGDTLPIVGRTADNQWFQVETDFGTGWVAAGFVVTRNEFGASPVTTASPAAADVAGPIGIVNTGALNVRTGPGAQYTSLGTLAGGTEVLIIGRNANWSWYLIETPVGTGWGRALYIVARGDTAGIPFVPAGATVDQGGGFAGGTAPEPVVTGPVAIVMTGALNVRTGPNSAFPSIGVVYAGTRLPIIGQSPDHGWWLVETSFGEGYITKALVTTEGNTSGVPVTQP